MQIQRELSIKVPKTFNDGAPIPQEIHRKIEAFLLTWYGGFTRLDVVGGWVNSAGKLFADQLYQYDIASGRWHGDNDCDDLLRKIAAIVKLDCAQESVYVRLFDGSVQFV